jgi:hygromycin-B 7''-O-kinase
MAAREYSRRLGSIDDGQFRSALERFGLGEFVRAEPVAGGLFGQNVFVASTTGEYVLRGAPHYDWQLPAERFFARLLHERTRAPVPWPYLLDPGDDIFGWSYAVMPRMPGCSSRTARRPRGSPATKDSGWPARWARTSR